jgi:hypothetical protein
MPWGNTQYMGSKLFTQEFVDFVSLNPGIIIDLISCSLSNPLFIQELNNIKKLYPSVTIEYSLDQTGFNPGNWILESSGVDIKPIYFTDKIDEWKHTLWYYPYNSGYNKKPIQFSTSVTIKGISNSGYTSSNLTDVVYILSNSSAFAALKSNGSVITWGDTTNGGNSSTVASNLTSGVVNIFSTNSTFAALKSNGSVITWGDPNNGGNSSTVASNLTSEVVNIFSNIHAFAALKSNGSVITWGDQTKGGNSSTVASNLTSGVVNIFSTDTAFAALKSNGSVITWGDTNNGGDSSTVASNLTSEVVDIFSNIYAFAALKSNGSVITWGNQTNGGNSSTVASNLSSGVVNIFITNWAFAALKSNGSVITWGDQNKGGNSSTVASNLTSGVINIFSTIYAFAALKSDGSVITWGDTTNGGNSSTVASNLTSGVVNIFSTVHAFAALKSDGSVITWGNTSDGGDSSTVASNLTSGVINIFSTYNAFAALKSNGSVITWGNQTLGGNSSNTGFNISYAYGNYNFVYVTSSQPIPVTPIFISKSDGILTISQKDFNTSNITSYEYKISPSLNWTTINLNTRKISGLTPSKSYFINLRAINSVGPSDYNSFLVNSNSNGEILVVISEAPQSQIPLSSICFPAGTPINTDQGLVPIEKISPGYHTIRNFKIEAITQTIQTSNYMICIEPNSLGNSIPSIKTIISPNHKVFYNKTMIEARELSKNIKGIYPIPYSGEVLYNVLLESYEKMIVNNLIVETLDPTNIIAQIYSKKFSNEKREYLIKKLNHFIKTKSKQDFKQLAKYLK